MQIVFPPFFFTKIQGQNEVVQSHYLWGNWKTVCSTYGLIVLGHIELSWVANSLYQGFLLSGSMETKISLSREAFRYSTFMSSCIRFQLNFEAKAIVSLLKAIEAKGKRIC